MPQHPDETRWVMAISDESWHCFVYAAPLWLCWALFGQLSAYNFANMLRVV